MRMRKDPEEEFFIGYAPPMPPRLGRFISRVVIAIGCLAIIGAVTLASGHLRVDGGTFEFGHPKSFSGTVIERPYPVLRLDGVDETVEPWPLLVGPGKHGADALVSGFDGRHITLTGTRIRRGAHTMIQVEPASLPRKVPAAASVDATALPGQSDKGTVELTGEIVDSKCFLGVMVPGSGKTHKECASLCLRGGIPPALYVHDRAGHSSLLLLVGPTGEPIGATALQAAGEAISLTGSMQRRGGWLVLRTDPTLWRRVD
jgi:hypothetical protein